jgi:hypothetical protein
MVNPALIFGMLGVGGGALAGFHGHNVAKRKKLIQSTPTTEIRMLKDGLSEVVGKVHTIETIRGPFSDKECVYYKYSVQEPKKDKKGHTHWRIVASGSKAVRFLLKDDTGEVTVDPKDAQIEVHVKESFSSGFNKEPPERIKKFLEDNKISYKGWFFNKSMKYHEVMIEKGDKLYILGTAKTNDAEGTKHLIEKGKDKGVFFISDSEEKDIVKKLHWESVIAYCVGGFFGLLGLMFLFMGLQG